MAIVMRRRTDARLAPKGWTKCVGACARQNYLPISVTQSKPCQPIDGFIESAITKTGWITRIMQKFVCGLLCSWWVANLFIDQIKAFMILLPVFISYIKKIRFHVLILYYRWNKIKISRTHLLFWLINQQINVLIDLPQTWFLRP